MSQRPSHRRLALAAGAALLLVPAVALASAGPDDSVRITTINASEHPDVTVFVTAPRDQVGAGLPPEAFALTEDGRPRPLLDTPRSIDWMGEEQGSQQWPGRARDERIVAGGDLSEIGERIAAIYRNRGLDPDAMLAGERVDGQENVAGLSRSILAEELSFDQLRDTYMLTYRSQADGRVELGVTIDHAGEQFEATRYVSMPFPVAVPFIASASLALGTVLVFLALALLLLTVLWPGETRSPLARRPRAGGSERSLPGIGALANQATQVVERNLTRRGWMPMLNVTLERAGVALRPGEYVVLAGSGVVAALAAGLVLSGWLVAVALAVVAVLLAWKSLEHLARRRRARFAGQLDESLQLLAGSLRAGYALLQAVDAVAKEAPSPTAEEYRRLVVETRLGRDLHDALAAMQERIGNEDFGWVVQAIDINREVGGDLAEVLDTVAGTIRERDQIRRQVKALSAEGRLSAIVLYVLPFAVGGFIALTNPDYLGVLLTERVGWLMLAAGGVLLAVGGVWLRKVVRIVF